MGIVVHHTASSTSTYNDTNYMWNNAPSKPVGAIYLARNGEIVVGAAGATNCAGLGGPYTTSKGTIAKDTANSRHDLDRGWQRRDRRAVAEGAAERLCRFGRCVVHVLQVRSAA